MINLYGGSDGIRDKGLLESAVSTPQASFGDQFLHSDIFHMAGAYLFHIVKNHPFIDGLKRTGAMAAFVFLKLNHYTFTADELRYERLVREVAEGKSGKQELARFFQKNSRRTRRTH